MDKLIIVLPTSNSQTTLSPELRNKLHSKQFSINRRWNNSYNINVHCTYMLNIVYCILALELIRIVIIISTLNGLVVHIHLAENPTVFKSRVKLPTLILWFVTLDMWMCIEECRFIILLC